jgi:SEL1 protein
MHLGFLHMRGVGVRRRSLQHAFGAMSHAAHAGVVQAMHTAAMMHLNGRGTAR